MNLRRAFGFAAFALLSCGGRSGLLGLAESGSGGASVIASGGMTAVSGAADGGTRAVAGGWAAVAGNAAAGGNASGGSVSSGGGGTSGGSAAIGPWATLSHEGPPAPHDNPFDFVGYVSSYTDVWSDDANSALIAMATPGYKAPSSGSLVRFESGALLAFNAGPEHLYQPPRLAGLSMSDLWLAEDYWGLEHSDGSSWSLHAQKAQLVWENAASDVWACTASTADNSNSYRLSHWDGRDWHEIATSFMAGFIPHGLWSGSATEAFVAGSTGLLHWNGSTYEVRECPGVSGWNAVWGVTGVIWTVGDGGAVARWQGDTCTLLPTQSVLGGPRALTDIWGSGPNNLWIVGERGSILRWRGSALELEPAGLDEDLKAVWGTASGTVWAVGNGKTILRRTF